MDVGVGSFVISDALFSKLDQAAAQRKPPAPSGDHDGAPTGATPFSKAKRPARPTSSAARGRRAQEIKTCAQLAAVGVARIVATRAISYHSHVGEYGLHWNFFLTLAVVKAVGILISARAAGVVSASLALSYQFALSLAGLQDYVNADHHDEDDKGSLFRMNKEGIVSLVGYVALHSLARFYARQSKLLVLSDRTATELAKKEVAYFHFYCTCACTAICWSCVFVLEEIFSIRVSRRSVNLAYVFWCFGINLTWLCAVYIGRLALDLRHRVHLFSAINKYAFLTFLFANLLVGMVNKAFDTLRANRTTGVCIVLAYMVVISITSHVLYTKLGGRGKGMKWLYKTRGKIMHSPESEL